MITDPLAPTLVGPRLSLRPYEAGFSDAELRRLHDWARDPELIQLSGGSALDMPFERFRDVFRERLARARQVSHGSASRSRSLAPERLYAILDEEARFIGRIGLFGLRPGGRSAELGIVIGEPARWGRGFGREAVGLLSDHAFDALGLKRITLFTFPDNRRAQRCFSAAGFEILGRIRRFSLDRGTHDEIEMRLTPALRLRALETETGARPKAERP